MGVLLTALEKAAQSDFVRRDFVMRPIVTCLANIRIHQSLKALDNVPRVWAVLGSFESDNAALYQNKFTDVDRDERTVIVKMSPIMRQRKVHDIQTRIDRFKAVKAALNSNRPV